MAALLAEPFVLASYPTASQDLPQSGQATQPTRSRYASASCSSKGNKDGYVTISVQGDGIHVLELSSTHASVSHTLGPSAFFAAPAVTRFEGSDASTSYAVMQSAADGISPKERGRTVWRWRDRQLRRPEDPPEPKLSGVFPNTVEHIWAPQGLPSHVIAVSSTGQIILADRDLNLISRSTKPDAHSTLLRSWLFQSKECTFLPHDRIHSGGMVVVCFISVLNRLQLRITLLHPMEDLIDFAKCDMGSHESITDISCDPSGYISILSRTGDWRSFRLGHDHTNTLTVTPLTESLQLSGIKFVSPSSSGKYNGPTLLSVGSSHVILAGMADRSPSEIILLFWDLQYSVVLASQTLTLPSTVTYTPKSLPSLELVSASRTQALLVISPAAQTGSKRKESVTQRRSTVFVVPFETPPVSTIAMAMGKARETRKWLQNTHNPSIGKGDPCAQLIKSMQSCIEQGRPQAAEAAFFAWVDEETVRLKHLQEKGSSVDDDEIHPSDEEERLKAGFKPSAAKKVGKRAPTKPVLTHRFVSSILNMVLRTVKPSELIYSPRIILYLVDRKAVSHAMVEGGFIPALRDHKDWESIYSSLTNIPDIPEADLVRLLGEVAKSHRRQQDSQDSNMQVDPSDIPPLPQFLAGLVNYTTSPATLRVAMKHHLTDVRDVVVILEVLERWVARWCSKSLNVEASSSAASRSARKKVRPSMNDGLPSLENIMCFLQSVMDTHFLALLQHSSCHDIIARLTQHFKQLLSSVDEMDRLKGPLESFIRTEAKEARLTRTRAGREGDWRKKRKEAHQATELAIGVYQIEELVI